MPRRPSHPHGQLTGLIVLCSLLLSVGLMFWLPSAATHTPALASGVTSTPALPITRTPRAEHAPVAAAPLLPSAVPFIEPTVDSNWISSPEPTQEPVIVAQPAPVIALPAEPVYVQAPPVVIVQEAAPIYIQDTPVVIEVHVPPALTVVPDVVRNQDFITPDPNAKCQFIDCLHQP